MIRALAVAVLFVSAVPAMAQDTSPPPDAPAAPVAAPVPAPPPLAPAPVYPTTKIAIATSQGTITVALEKVRAPLTTAYFLRYVDQKRLDGTTFYRANKLTPDGGYGLIQGGVQSDPKRVLPPVAHESTTKTGLSHSDGAISLARLAPGSATANFFLCIGDLSPLDADPRKPGDNQGFAAFGHVVEGMDVVKKILAAPTSPTAGGPGMKGQMIAAPVRITSVRRVP